MIGIQIHYTQGMGRKVIEQAAIIEITGYPAGGGELIMQRIELIERLRNFGRRQRPKALIGPRRVSPLGTRHAEQFARYPFVDQQRTNRGVDHIEKPTERRMIATLGQADGIMQQRHPPSVIQIGLCIGPITRGFDKITVLVAQLICAGDAIGDIAGVLLIESGKDRTIGLEISVGALISGFSF